MLRETIEYNMTAAAAEKVYLEKVISPVIEEAKALETRLHTAEEQADKVVGLYGEKRDAKYYGDTARARHNVPVPITLFKIEHPVLGEGEVVVKIASEEDHRDRFDPVVEKYTKRRHYTLEYLFAPTPTEEDPTPEPIKLGDTSSKDGVIKTSDNKKCPGVRTFLLLSQFSTHQEVARALEYLPRRDVEVAEFEQGVADIVEALQNEELNPHERLRLEKEAKLQKHEAEMEDQAAWEAEHEARVQLATKRYSKTFFFSRPQ